MQCSKAAVKLQGRDTTKQLKRWHAAAAPRRRARLLSPPHHGVAAAPLEFSAVLPDDKRDVLLLHQREVACRHREKGKAGAGWAEPLSVEPATLRGRRTRWGLIMEAGWQQGACEGGR